MLDDAWNRRRRYSIRSGGRRSVSGFTCAACVPSTLGTPAVVGPANPREKTVASVGFNGDEDGSKPSVAIVYDCCHTFPTGRDVLDVGCVGNGGAVRRCLCVSRYLRSFVRYSSPRMVVIVGCWAKVKDWGLNEDEDKL